MSYFCANSIRFSKDFKEFQVKGGDNNVIPRFNEWSNWIDIDKLYYNIIGGGIQFVGNNEKCRLVDYVVRENKLPNYWCKFTYDVGQETYENFIVTEQDKKDVKKFTEEFIIRLKNALKTEYSTEKNHIIKYDRGYIRKLISGGFYPTNDRDTAVKLTKYRAIFQANRFPNYSATAVQY